MGGRRRSREIAVQVLYQAEMAGDAPDKAFEMFCEHFRAPEEIRIFAIELIKGVHSHLVQIDLLVRRFSDHWRLERMSTVDRSVLRLAVFEFLYRPDIPTKVSINEAVELGKKFGSEDSGSFINGVLDRIRFHLEEEGEGRQGVAGDIVAESRLEDTTEEVQGAENS